MSDIDFEELDRAVNSLIASAPGAPATTVATPQVDMYTQGPIAEVPAEVIQPVIAPIIENSGYTETIVETVNTEIEPLGDGARPAIERPAFVAASRSLAGQRSSGRFMDVIHPSTNMRSSTPLPDVQIVPPTPPVADSQMLSTPSLSRNNTLDEQKPLESPFISGAVVEKRPLGAFSSEPEQADIELSPTGEVSEGLIEPDTDIAKTDELLDLPDELGGDLLKIESDVAEQPAEPEMLLEPVIDNQPSGPTSITQQYAEQPAEVDKKTSSIYDTNVYHNASTGGSKKKSGWMWIVWIILLLAVGVGAGALTYFYVLPLL